MDRTQSAPHGVGALATLTLFHENGAPRATIPIHGPDVYIGRYHPQNGPVDILFDVLHDEEIYKLGAPHIRLQMTPTGRWTVRLMSGLAFAYVNRKLLTDTDASYQLHDQDILKLGVVEFKFEKTELEFQEWKDQQKAILLAEEVPTLFLVRAGAVCGPKVLLRDTRTTVIGRTFPGPGILPGDFWDVACQPDWDLSGLEDREKKFIGFRHCEVWCEGDDWFVKPVSSRQRTYINRVEITSARPLIPGDELGLGSVVFHFHHPSNIRASTDRKTVDLPVVLDWREGYARANDIAEEPG